MARVQSFPHSLADAIDALFDRLCEVHGSGAVSSVFTTLLNLSVTNVGGVSEEELQVSAVGIRVPFRSLLWIFYLCANVTPSTYDDVIDWLLLDIVHIVSGLQQSV